MPDLVQILAIVVSVLLLMLVLELVRRKLLGEEYALLWIVGGLLLIAISVWRGALDAMARWLGVLYGPAVLLLLLAFFVFVALLFFSVVVSRQRLQIDRLIEDAAILDARHRDIMARLDDLDGQDHSSDLHPPDAPPERHKP